MCFDADSLPPIPVLAGGALGHEDLVLESEDGARFAAFAALPDEAPRACVVILPDVRGLYRFYEELALRFAERGYAAVAIDYFGRSAGVEKRGDDFDYPPHVEQTTPEGVQADVAAAAHEPLPPKQKPTVKIALQPRLRRSRTQAPTSACTCSCVSCCTSGM